MHRSLQKLRCSASHRVVGNWHSTTRRRAKRTRVMHQRKRDHFGWSTAFSCISLVLIGSEAPEQSCASCCMLLHAAACCRAAARRVDAVPLAATCPARCPSPIWEGARGMRHATREAAENPTLLAGARRCRSMVSLARSLAPLVSSLRPCGKRQTEWPTARPSRSRTHSENRKQRK